MSYMRKMRRSVQRSQGTFESARQRKAREEREAVLQINENAGAVAEWFMM